MKDVRIKDCLILRMDITCDGSLFNHLGRSVKHINTEMSRLFLLLLSHFEISQCLVGINLSFLLANKKIIIAVKRNRLGILAIELYQTSFNVLSVYCFFQLWGC